jgi:hypothetical protein
MDCKPMARQGNASGLQPIDPLKLSETNHDLFHQDSLRPAVSRLSIDARAGAPAFVSPTGGEGVATFDLGCESIDPSTP